MAETRVFKKVLSVAAHPNERAENPSFGLVKAIENKIDEFLKENKGEQIGFELAGTTIDPGAASAQDASAVFGRTLIVLTWKKSN